MIHHLNRSGRMGMVLANGALSSQTNNEGEIRAKIVDADLVEASSQCRTSFSTAPVYL